DIQLVLREHLLPHDHRESRPRLKATLRNLPSYKMDDLLTSYISLMLSNMNKQKTLRSK
ncbi:Uncharacterized protein FKW44_014072, partial [Caligus rogercresseyi]